MEIRYSPHAKKRLRERGISENVVRLTLANPDKVSSADRDRFIVRKKMKQKSLEVIYVKENGKTIIRTYAFGQFRR
jgi:hypothetical protein